MNPPKINFNPPSPSIYPKTKEQIGQGAEGIVYKVTEEKTTGIETYTEKYRFLGFFPEFGSIEREYAEIIYVGNSTLSLQENNQLYFTKLDTPNHPNSTHNI